MSEIAPLLITVDDILKTLNIGRSKFYELVATGEFAPEPLRVFGKKKLYKVSDVQDWVNRNCPTREQWQRGNKCQ